MKKLVLSLVVLLLLSLNQAGATPQHYGSFDCVEIGGKRICPIKPGIAAWGTTADGEYFDELNYSNEAQLKIPRRKGVIDVTIRKSEISTAQIKEMVRSFSFEFDKLPKNFEGEIEIEIINSSGTHISRTYKPKNNYNLSNGYFVYQAMDLEGAEKNAKIKVNLILTNNKKIVIPVDDLITWQWGMIAGHKESIGRLE